MRLLSDWVNFEATVAALRLLEEVVGVRVGGSSDENKAEMNWAGRQELGYTHAFTKIFPESNASHVELWESHM